MASTSATSTAKTTEGDMPLKHDIPPPISFEKSKLDWLLAINEQYFEAELQTVVSVLNHSQSNLLRYQPISNVESFNYPLSLSTGLQYAESNTNGGGWSDLQVRTTTW